MPKTPEKIVRYRKKNAEKVRRWRWKQLGVKDVVKAEELFQKKTTCEICGHLDGDSRTGNGLLHLDHDHSTGKIRGFLCSNCNRAVGLMKDDPVRLIKASAYLLRKS